MEILDNFSHLEKTRKGIKKYKYTSWFLGLLNIFLGSYNRYIAIYSFDEQLSMLVGFEAFSSYDVIVISLIVIVVQFFIAYLMFFLLKQVFLFKVNSFWFISLIGGGVLFIFFLVGWGGEGIIYDL